MILSAHARQYKPSPPIAPPTWRANNPPPLSLQVRLTKIDPRHHGAAVPVPTPTPQPRAPPRARILQLAVAARARKPAVPLAREGAVVVCDAAGEVHLREASRDGAGLGLADGVQGPAVGAGD